MNRLRLLGPDPFDNFRRSDARTFGDLAESLLGFGNDAHLAETIKGGL